MNTDCIINIFRTTGELYAVINHSGYEFKDTSDGPPAEELNRWYSMNERPLDSLDWNLIRPYKQLMESWKAVANLRAWDEESLFHIMVILLETAPIFVPPAQHRKLTVPPFEPPEIIPTARHPRAYKGTTYKLSKKKTLSRLDLRPYLCDRKQVHLLLHKLTPYWESALQNLSHAGYDTDNLPRAGLERGDEINPYYVFHYKLHSDPGAYKLPLKFIKYLLPLLQGKPWRSVLDMLSIYWGASVQHDPALLNAMSRLLHLNNGKNVRQWLRLVMGCPQHRRAMFVTLLTELEVYLVDAGQCSLSHIERFHKLTSDEYYQRRLLVFLRSLKKRVQADYLLAGFQLANRHDADNKFYYVHGSCALFPQNCVKAIVEHIKEVEDYHDSFTMSIWSACGEHEGFSEFLGAISWRLFSPVVAFRLLSLHMHFFDRWELSANRVREKWHFVRQRASSVQLRLMEVYPDYREKFLLLLRDFYWYWDDVEELREYMPLADQLAGRLATPPFSTKKGESSEALSYFIDSLPVRLRERFLQAPDSSLLNFEKTCRSKNKARLISNGIAAMVKEAPRFTIECHTYFSRKLCGAAKLLGILRRPERHELLSRFNRHPLRRADSHAFSVQDYCRMVEKHCDSDITNPIPKKLRQYIHGHLSLSENRIRRYTEKLNRNIYSTLLDILEKQARREFHQPLDPGINPDGDWEHAMQIMRLLDDNRRGFKRFLREYAKGNTTYIRNHPETRAWITAHPGMNTAVWENGIQWSRISEKHGIIRIQLEQEPLEALKLGTYLGTCLGVGGDLVYSAAAAVLDYNKQVLYARNENNTVVARQLAAISEEDQLVCFSVYPVDADTEILTMFRDYDILFADELGIELRKGGQDYSIKQILSKRWWDDWPWDFDLRS